MSETAEDTPLQRWAYDTTVTLQRFQFERAVLNLNRIEALALIRAAYDCSLDDGKRILNAIRERPGY